MLNIEIILALLVVAGLFFLARQFRTLDKKKEELDKYAVSLAERASLLTANEKSCDNLMRDFNRMYLEFKNKDIYTASYTETEADTMRYTTDALMAAHARKHLASIIAQDIVKQFKVVESKTEDGRRKFTYKFKIVEQ